MSEMLPRYDTKLFTEIWETVNDFCYDYQNIGIPTTIEVTNAITLYYLLYARYGNNPIANFDEEQFKYKIFSIIWQYGPTWEKKLSIQTNLRDLTEAELLQGSKAIHNQALNPSTEPTTQTLDELNYINQQNTTSYKRNKLEAYGTLWSLLSNDVTEEFIKKFKICFKLFVTPERTFIYKTEEDDDNE